MKKKPLIKFISHLNFDIKKNYKLYRKVMEIVYAHPFQKQTGKKQLITIKDREIPIYLFTPKTRKQEKVILFYHGGGFVSGSISSYNGFCQALADALDQLVIVTDYRLAPEFPFPNGLQDCYEVTEYLYTYLKKQGKKEEDITLMGDSAGGNFTAVISLMARDQKAFSVYQQVLLYPLLVNEKTGGISAALEVDEEKDLCGRYNYCWPRDAVTISQALDMIGMYDEADKFYNIFLRKTQSKNGMWEQRFYTDGRLAPCWGYQIDETASVLVGIYQHFKIKEFRKKEKDMDLLIKNLDMCENATEFLKRYVDHLMGKEEEEVPIEEKYSYLNRKQIYKHVSYDLWEMNEGVHLYSISAIYAAFDAMEKIYLEIQKENKKFKMPLDFTELSQYRNEIKEYILNNLVDKNQNILKRNTNDNSMDISILGAITPFKVFKPDEEIVKNTIQKINLTLRTYTGGILRFENDGYMGGKNPWPIATLWMYMYYKMIGAEEEAIECFRFIVKTATNLGFLAEQIDNDKMEANWVIGLGWSHAMFILALGIEELM